jgi:hypothetical protein
VSAIKRTALLRICAPTATGAIRPPFPARHCERRFRLTTATDCLRMESDRRCLTHTTKRPSMERRITAQVGARDRPVGDQVAVTDPSPPKSEPTSAR